MESPVKNPSLRIPAFPFPRAVAMACCAALGSALCLPVWAQPLPQDAATAGEVGIDATGGAGMGFVDTSVAPADERPRAGIWVEPRITAGMALSTNGSLSSVNPQSEQMLEVSPGLRVVMNTGRLKGFFDYALSSRYYAQGTSGNNFHNALNTDMTLEAVDKHVYVDFAGLMTDERISAFGVPSFSNVSDANRTETAAFRLSPYLKGTLAGDVDYELRYSFESLNTDEASRSDVTIHGFSVRLRSDAARQRLGWILDASTEDVDYSLGRRTRASIVQGGVFYALSSQLMLTLMAGTESNDIITLERRSYHTAGLNLQWRPSPRTSLAMGVEDRYFGRGHNFSLEHRSGRTVWRVIDSRSVINSPFDGESSTLGAIYDLIDNLFVGQEPDPVRRAQLVQAELLRLGLPADSMLADGFLTSSARLARTQQISAALLGPRYVITLALARSDERRLHPVGALGDDFDLADRIRQRSWSINYAHRLTPITSASITFSREKTMASGLGLDSGARSLSLGVTTRLSLRTSGNLLFQRSVGGGNWKYGETTAAGFITHRF